MKRSKAIEYFGSQVNLAKGLGITKSSVSQWSDLVPEKQALKLDRITGGQLKYDPTYYATSDQTGQEKTKGA